MKFRIGQNVDWAGNIGVVKYYNERKKTYGVLFYNQIVEIHESFLEAI